MLAAESGTLECMKILLDYGAKGHLRNKKREQAIDLAEASGHKEAVELLKEYSSKNLFKLSSL